MDESKTPDLSQSIRAHNAAVRVSGLLRYALTLIPDLELIQKTLNQPFPDSARNALIQMGKTPAEIDLHVRSADRRIKPLLAFLNVMKETEEESLAFHQTQHDKETVLDDVEKKLFGK